jgi:hypothetical protein
VARGGLLKGLPIQPALKGFPRLVPLDDSVRLLALELAEAQPYPHLLQHARNRVPVVPELARGLRHGDIPLPPVGQSQAPGSGVDGTPGAAGKFMPQKTHGSVGPIVDQHGVFFGRPELSLPHTQGPRSTVNGLSVARRKLVQKPRPDLEVLGPGR